MPLEEETCTKIWGKAPLKDLTGSPLRRAAIRGGCYLLPCQHCVLATPGGGTAHLGVNFTLSDAEAEPGLWMLYRLI